MISFTRYLFLLLTCIICFNFSHAECQKGRVALQVLGSGGPELSDQRASSSYLIWLDNQAKVMVDAGGGSSYNFEKTGAKFNDIKALAFTHFHVDHSADISVYIKSSYFTSRQNDLLLFGPDGNSLMPSMSEYIDALLQGNGAYPYLNEYVSDRIESDYKIKVNNVSLKQSLSEYLIDDDIKLSAVPVHHGPIAALAWRVDVANCVIVFSGDMSNKYKSLSTLAKQADILVAHNAVPENAHKLALNLHMPPSEIGKIAHKANVKSLVLSHRMKRTLGVEENTLEIIREYYSNEIVFADDLSMYQL